MTMSKAKVSAGAAALVLLATTLQNSGVLGLRVVEDGQGKIAKEDLRRKETLRRLEAGEEVRPGAPSISAMQMMREQEALERAEQAGGSPRADSESPIDATMQAAGAPLANAAATLMNLMSDKTSGGDAGEERADQSFFEADAGNSTCTIEDCYGYFYKNGMAQHCADDPCWDNSTSPPEYRGMDWCFDNDPGKRMEQGCPTITSGQHGLSRAHYCWDDIKKNNPLLIDETTGAESGFIFNSCCQKPCPCLLYCLDKVPAMFLPFDAMGHTNGPRWLGSTWRNSAERIMNNKLTAKHWSPNYTIKKNETLDDVVDLISPVCADIFDGEDQEALTTILEEYFKPLCTNNATSTDPKDRAAAALLLTSMNAEASQRPSSQGVMGIGAIQRMGSNVAPTKGELNWETPNDHRALYRDNTELLGSDKLAGDISWLGYTQSDYAAQNATLGDKYTNLSSYGKAPVVGGSIPITHVGLGRSWGYWWGSTMGANKWGFFLYRVFEKHRAKLKKKPMEVYECVMAQLTFHLSKYEHIDKGRTKLLMEKAKRQKLLAEDTQFEQVWGILDSLTNGTCDAKERKCLRASMSDACMPLPSGTFWQKYGDVKEECPLCNFENYLPWLSSSTYYNNASWGNFYYRSDITSLLRTTSASEKTKFDSACAAGTYATFGSNYGGAYGPSGGHYAEGEKVGDTPQEWCDYMCGAWDFRRGKGRYLAAMNQARFGPGGSWGKWVGKHNSDNTVDDWEKAATASEVEFMSSVYVKLISTNFCSGFIKSIKANLDIDLWPEWMPKWLQRTIDQATDVVLPIVKIFSPGITRRKVLNSLIGASKRIRSWYPRVRIFG